MRNTLGFVFALLVAGCVSPPSFAIPVFAHAAPNGEPSKEQDVTNLSTALGYNQGDTTCPGIVWSKSYLARWQWDVAMGHSPLIKVAPRSGGHTVMLSDIAAGKIDASLKTDSDYACNLGGSVIIDLLYEPTTQIYEKLANPSLDPNVYVGAYAHIAPFFACANVTLVFTPGSSLFAGNWQAWDPGTEAWLGEDDYDWSQSPVVCSIAPPLGRAYAIMETGALAGQQATWIANVASACPNAALINYFDAVGTSGNSYVLDAEGVAALASVGL